MPARDRLTCSSTADPGRRVRVCAWVGGWGVFGEWGRTARAKERSCSARTGRRRHPEESHSVAALAAQSPPSPTKLASTSFRARVSASAAASAAVSRRWWPQRAGCGAPSARGRVRKGDKANAVVAMGGSFKLHAGLPRVSARVKRAEPRSEAGTVTSTLKIGPFSCSSCARNCAVGTAGLAREEKPARAALLNLLLR